MNEHRQIRVDGFVMKPPRAPYRILTCAQEVLTVVDLLSLVFPRWPNLN